MNSAEQYFLFDLMDFVGVRQPQRQSAALPLSMTRAREEVDAVMPSDARFVYFPSEASIFPIGVAI